MSTKFRLYDETGLQLLYSFPTVQESNYPQTPKKAVIIEGIRGKGGIVIDGGEELWTLTIRGYLYADDYEALIVLIEEMEDEVELNTKYVLKIAKTTTTDYEYNVKRIEVIEYGDTNFRNNFIEYQVKFLVNSW